MVAPALRASAITASTSSREPTLWAGVIPPQPPLSVTQESSASLARSQSATIIPPAWKKTVSASGCEPTVQPSAS